MIRKVRRKINFFILFAIPFFIIALSVYFFAIRAYSLPKTQAIYELEKTSVDLQAESVKKGMEYFISEILYLTAMVNEELKSTSVSSKRFNRSISKLFYEVMATKLDIGQLRVLDLNGMEVVRVDNGISGTSVSRKSELQDKSHRYYFIEGSRYGVKNKLYISPLDLNVEQGKVEIPYKPMIRVTMPIIKDLKMTGLLVGNFLAETLLEKIRTYDFFKHAPTQMLNGQGYWFKGLNKEVEWGFMFKEKNHSNMTNLLPSIWNRMKSLDRGQFHLKDGIYTYTSIKPFSCESLKSQIPVLLQLLNCSHEPYLTYRWYFFSHIPSNKIKGIFGHWNIFAQSVLWIIVILGLVIIWLVVSSKIEKDILFEKQETLVSQLKVQTNDLQENNRNLEYLNRKLHEFVGVVSHDLRNPIGFIQSSVELIRSGELSSEDEKVMLEKVQNSASTSLDFIKDILELAALGSGKIRYNFGPVYVNALLGAVCSDMDFLAMKKDIRLEKQVDIDCRVVVDEKRIRQILENLISNAIKFSKKGSRVKVGAKEEAGMVCFYVQDYGKGIESDALGIILDKGKHFSTPGTQGEKGTGFGIALCLELLEAHHTTLLVESKKDEGSIFSFHIDQAD